MQQVIQQEWFILENSDSFQQKISFLSWAQLQKGLQKQYYMALSQSQQIQSLKSELIEKHAKYYQHKLTILNAEHILDEAAMIKNDAKVLGNGYSFCKQALLRFGSNPVFAARLFLSLQNTNENRDLAIHLCNNCFDNLIETRVTLQPIMGLLSILLIQLLKKGVDDRNGSLGQQVLCGYLKKHAKYINNILQPVKFQLMSLKKNLSLDEQQQSKAIKLNYPSIQKKKQKAQNCYEQYANILKSRDKHIYGYDSLIASRMLIKRLGLDLNPSVPRFNRDLQYSRLLHEKGNTIQKYIPVQQQKSNGLRLIQLFFKNLFNSVLNIDSSILLICKLVQCMSNNVKKDLRWLFFKCYLINNIQLFQNTLNQKQKLLASNSKQLKSYISQILLNQIIPTQSSSILLQIIASFQIQIDLFLQSFLKFSLSKQDPLLKGIFSDSSKISSTSIFLSINHIKLLFQKIVSQKQIFSKIDKKIVDRANRFILMQQDIGIFKGIKLNDKHIPPQKAFFQFSQIHFPQSFTKRPLKQYTQYYKTTNQQQVILNRTLDLFRQVLVQLQSLYNLKQQCSSSQYIIDALNIFKLNMVIDQFSKSQMSSIPMTIRIQYFTELLSKLPIQKTKNNLKFLYERLKNDLSERQKRWKHIIRQQKVQLIKAQRTLIRHRDSLAQNIKTKDQQRRKQKIFQIIQQNMFDICITSQISRQKLLGTYQYSVTNNLQSNKIWISPVSECVHRKCNIQFISRLAGQLQINLQTLSHSSSIKAFIQSFCSLPQVKQCIYTGQDKYNIQERFFQFIQVLNDKVDNLNQDKDWVIKTLRKYMDRSIYQKIFPRRPTYSDLGVYFRLDSLGWISNKQMKIQQQTQNGLVILAAKSLQKIDQMKSPQQKLNCIQECFRITNNILRLTTKESAIGADLFLPYIILVLINAKPKKLISSMNYIKLFSKLQGKTKFNISTLQMCIDFCKIVSQKQLAGITKKQFAEKIEQRQQKSQIYFLRRQSG